MATEETTVPPLTGLAELRAEIEQFYARHFHLLDAGAAGEWAATFTADGAFFPPGGTEPVRGRPALESAVLRAHAKDREEGLQRRHWHGMVAVEPRPDGTLAVRCYAQILATPRGGPSRLHLSCVCEDVFRQQDGKWLVHERHVTRDDLS